MKKNILNLNLIRQQRSKLRTKSFDLLTKADNLRIKADTILGDYTIMVEEIVKRWLIGENPSIESYNPKAQAFKLFLKDDKLWTEAIFKKYGNIKVELIKRVEQEFK